jgi:hypothetical protein
MYRYLDSMVYNGNMASAMPILETMSCSGLYNCLSLYATRNCVWAIDPIYRTMVRIDCPPNMTRVAMTSLLYEAFDSVNHIIDHYDVDVGRIQRYGDRHQIMLPRMSE